MLTSPLGIAYWAVVFEPRDDHFDPEKPRAWSISWCADERSPEALQMVQTIEKEFARIHGDGAKPSKNAWPFKDQTDKEGNATGLLEFRLKKNETTKKGNVLSAPTVIDSRKNPWPADTLIGNGSKVKVAFTVWGWEDRFGKKGVSLSLEAVQVIDLVPFERVDPSAAFGEEEGFVADTPASAFKAEAELSPSQRMRQRAQPDFDPEEIPF